MTTRQTKSSKELRRFGLVMAVPLGIIAALLLWRGRTAGPYAAGAAIFFLAAGLLVPRILAPLERIWMAFAQVLGAVMTRVILTLTYYIVMTPFGFLLRLLGKDLLELKLDPKRESYWVAVEEDGPCTRPEKPY